MFKVPFFTKNLSLGISIHFCFLTGLLISLYSCGSDDAEKTTSQTSTTTYTFATDINPILKKSCSGASTCHGSSGESSSLIFVDAKAFFIQQSASVIKRLDGSGGDLMPPASSGITLSSANKQILKDYLNQSTRD